MGVGKSTVGRRCAKKLGRPFVDTDDLVERYARNTTRDLSHITWYTVLACFKLGIVLEGTLARACAGKAPKEIGELLHTATVQLFEQACELMDSA